MICRLRNWFGVRFGHLDIVWLNVFMLSMIHVAALYGFYLKFLNVNIYTRLFAIFYCHVSGCGVTAGRHRYFSHRSFKGNRAVDILLAMMACTTFEQSIYTWCRDHRLHHKHSETDADPYNSNRGFFFCHVGWILVRKHKDVKEKGKSIDMSDLLDNPVVMFEYKYCLQLALIFTVLIPTLVPWYFWNESLAVTFFYGTVYRFVLILHITWSVNSFAHLYGMRNYDKHINPAENTYVSTISMGEGFHNYHHTFPWDYKAAELSNDFRNFTTFFIDSLAYFGMVTERKTASKQLIGKRIERTGDPGYKSSTSIVKNIFGYLLFVVLLA
ncbi:acyl-CoA Delta-9 desaturase-like [Atheta coriaria]|uniref:acyl-CoA Delta-9 desaturase-like n=1 Tax=Dalotia coriaria TaxID=877792 RepID=UPI0031F3AC85